MLVTIVLHYDYIIDRLYKGSNVEAHLIGVHYGALHTNLLIHITIQPMVIRHNLINERQHNFR